MPTSIHPNSECIRAAWNFLQFRAKCETSVTLPGWTCSYALSFVKIAFFDAEGRCTTCLSGHSHVKMHWRAVTIYGYMQWWKFKLTHTYHKGKGAKLCWWWYCMFSCNWLSSAVQRFPYNCSSSSSSCSGSSSSNRMMVYSGLYTCRSCCRRRNLYTDTLLILCTENHWVVES